MIQNQAVLNNLGVCAIWIKGETREGEGSEFIAQLPA